MVEDKKEVLAKKAAQLFLDGGYHNVSMKKLAEAVGFQPSAIYYYFKGKDEILKHLEVTYAAKFRENVVAAMDRIETAEGKIRVLIKNVIELLIDFPEISLLMTQRVWPQECAESIKAKERGFVRAIHGWLKELAAEKRINNPVDPAVATFCLIGMTSWICKWFNPKGKLSTEELVEHVTRLFFNGFYDLQARFEGYRYPDESLDPGGVADSPSAKGTKEWLLAKAAELFVEQGYRKTSMRQIGEAAKIQAPAIYHHFKSKEDLFKQLDDESARRFRTYVIEAVEGLTDSEEKVERLLRRTLFLITNYGETAMLLTDQVASRKAGRIRKQKAKEYVLFIRTILEHLVKVKSIGRPIDPTVATFCLIGMTSWSHRWYHPDKRIKLEDLIRDMTRFFFHGYYAPPVVPLSAARKPGLRPIEEGIMALPPASPIPHLIGGRCARCGKLSFPKRCLCPDCFDQGQVDEVELSSVGRLSSWTVVRRGMAAGKEAYALGYLDLPEGLTILSPLSVADSKELRIGMKMQAVFEEEADPEIGPVVVYRFRPVE